MVFQLISTISVLLAYAIFASGYAIRAEDNSLVKGAGFHKLDFYVDRNSSANRGTLAKRGYANVQVIRDGDRYLTTLNFGSNSQPIIVQLDTGSSDTWVNSEYYDRNPSTTNKSLNESYTIYYVTGFAHGEYVTDTVTIPEGPTLENFQFADVDNGTWVGILGLSHISQESLKGQGPRYPNFPLALKNAGYIKKNAYSLYLNEDEATTGSIIFGGIDTEKYLGDLVPHPFSKPNFEMAIILGSVTTSVGSHHFTNYSVSMDCGADIIYLPGDIVQAIADDAGLNYNQTSQIVDVDCNDELSGNLGFTFGSQTIEIPLQKFVVFDETSGNCTFGITGDEQADNVKTLGEIFLKTVYAVYDLDANTLLLAPAVYTSDSNIIAID